MNRHIRRVLRRAALAGTMVTALLVATLAVTGTPASAHTKLDPHPSCPGSQVNHLHNNLSIPLTAFVFYSSANGGTNCMWVQKETHRGHQDDMVLVFQRCATGNPSNPCNPTLTRRDPETGGGSFQFYAGPLQFGQADNRCIRFRVRIHGNWTAWSGRINCG